MQFDFGIICFMQEIGLDSSLIKHVLDGTKTIEGRLGKPKFLRIRVGDQISVREDIRINNEVTQTITNKLIILITQILYFESFDEMFSSVDFSQAIPSATTKDEAIAAYMQFYTAEDEKEHGVISFSFEIQ